MTNLWLALALLLPWLTGALWVRHAWCPGQPGRVSGAIGYGYFLGILGTAGLLLLFEYLTGRWQFQLTLAVLAALAVAAALTPLRPPRQTARGFRQSTAEWRRRWRNLPFGYRVLIAVLIGLITLRLATLFAEIVWRPVWAWDAWYFWTYRAKAMLAAGSADVGAYASTWLLEPTTTYTFSSPHPPTVSLFQLWPELATKEWLDSAASMPWWFAACALALAIYGQLRAAGLSVLVAVTSVYLLVSLPIFDVHTALAGYADLWTSAFYTLAAMGLYLALAQGARRQAALALACVIALPTLKYLNIAWLSAFALAAVLAPMRLRYSIPAIVLGAALLIGWALTLGIELWIPGFGRIAADAQHVFIAYAGNLEYQAIWSDLYTRVLIDPSWHLLWYLAPIVMLAGLVKACRSSAHRGLAVAVLAGLAVLLIGFALTRQSVIVSEGTGINRHLLAIAPTILLWGVLMLRESGAIKPMSPKGALDSVKPTRG